MDSSLAPADLSRKLVEAVRRATRKAVEEHRRLGFPVASWKDGKVVWIPPEEIPIYDEKSDPPDQPPAGF